MQTHLLQDLAIVMAIAGAMTLVCHRLRQPVVIGYLVAGLLIGPYTPPFKLVSSLESIHTMAELGLVFLLFSLGLEFNLPKIRRVGVSAGLAAVLEVGSMFGIGYLLGRAFGWRPVDSLFLGAILSISSTTIIVKVFMDLKMMQEKFAQVVFGILVLEDIVAVAILSVLSGLGAHGGPDASTILSSVMRITLFVVLFLVLGLMLVPRFIHWVARFGSKEVLGIVTLGFCLGGSLLASKFELSIALGAFLTGAVLAASDEIRTIEDWVSPVRDMFSAIFFVSAGMLIQPKMIVDHWMAITIVTLVTIVGKVASGAAGSFLAGYDAKTSARVGMSVAQIGEFSFVIASLGMSLRLTSDFIYPLAVAVSSLTTLATPYLIRNSDRAVETLASGLPTRFGSALQRYESWVSRAIPSTGQSRTAIFSRYLVRLVIYAVLMFAVILALSRMSAAYLETAGPGADYRLGIFWAIAGTLSVPIFLAISKYANHLLLLLVSRSKILLRHISVHAFYSALHGLTVVALAVAFASAARPYVEKAGIVAAVAVVVLIMRALARRPMRVAMEWLEGALDEITGLATSEPTRQAVLRSGDNLLLVDITDQIALPAASFALHRSIRDIRLRESTGASIVAIYRDGKHIANPAADTELLPDDVIVLLGDEAELAKARELFLRPS